FVSSDTLLESKRRIGAEVHHAPHGVDLEHFRTASRSSTGRPAGVPDGAPIIGYFGLVAPWIDLELIDQLAARHPGWQFVMIGRLAVDPSSVPARPNLHLQGPVNYRELPSIAAWFDVAIIP